MASLFQRSSYMRKMTVYITRQVALSTLFITLTLTAALWLVQSLRFLNLALLRTLDLQTFVLLAALLLPQLLTLLLPASLLIGVLFVYNRLIGDNELVVMRAVGASGREILRPALLVSMGVMAMLYALHLYLLPWSMRVAREVQDTMRSRVSLAALQEGQFNVAHDLTFYIRKRRGPNTVSGVIVHSAKPGQRAFTVTARQGTLVNRDGETRLILRDGVRYDAPGDRGQSPAALRFEEYVVDFAGTTAPGVKRPIPLSEYPTNKLLNPDLEIRHEISAWQFMVRAHQRFLAPLYAVLFVMLALAVLLSGDLNRRGRTKKNLLATGLCVAWQMGILTFMNLAEKMPLFMIVAYAFLGLPFVVLALHFYEKVNLDIAFGEGVS